MDTINPLMSFSPEDIANMDQEVEDIFNESDESDDGKKDVTAALSEPGDSADELSSSSAESLSGEHPHGWSEMKENSRKRAATTGTESDQEEEEDTPSTKFRRGEELPSDLDMGEGEDSVGSDEPPDEVDDGDWNMMGAALEREFLSGG